MKQIKVKKLPVLVGGNGQQRTNKKKATAFIAKELFGVDEYDEKTGVFISKKTAYRVAAYATDDKGAMIGSPNAKEKCIQTHPERALLCRKHFENSTMQWLVYAVDTQKLPIKTTIRWSEIETLADQCWTIIDK
jgi:hypothetical protein